MRIDLVLASAPVVDRAEWCVIDRNARKGKRRATTPPSSSTSPTDPTGLSRPAVLRRRRLGSRGRRSGARPAPEPAKRRAAVSRPKPVTAASAAGWPGGDGDRLQVAVRAHLGLGEHRRRARRSPPRRQPPSGASPGRRRRRSSGGRRRRAADRDAGEQRAAAGGSRRAGRPRHDEALGRALVTRRAAGGPPRRWPPRSSPSGAARAPSRRRSRRRCATPGPWRRGT